MPEKTGLVIIENSIGPGIARFKKKSKIVMENALAKGGLQLINWVVNGSPSETVVPPIRDGLLRGSGSVFVGSKFISATPRVMGKGDPAKSYSGKKNTITIGFNTDYAAAIHENLRPAGDWQPGPTSQKAGNVGGKFLEKHIFADKDLLFKFIAKLMEADL